mgnify:FL=1
MRFIRTILVIVLLGVSFMGGATVRGLHDALRNAPADLGNAVADTLRELPGYTLAPTPYTLRFVGDIMLSRTVGRIMEKQDD